MIDEIFDLKDKNQWLRQPLMTIVKSYMKNIKGDSMNRLGSSFWNIILKLVLALNLII